MNLVHLLTIFKLVQSIQSIYWNISTRMFWKWFHWCTWLYMSQINLSNPFIPHLKKCYCTKHVPNKCAFHNRDNNIFLWTWKSWSGVILLSEDLMSPYELGEYRWYERVICGKYLQPTEAVLIDFNLVECWYRVSTNKYSIIPL